MDSLQDFTSLGIEHDEIISLFLRYDFSSLFRVFFYRKLCIYLRLTELREVGSHDFIKVIF